MDAFNPTILYDNILHHGKVIDYGIFTAVP
jgi:hypothetical protein